MPMEELGDLGRWKVMTYVALGHIISVDTTKVV